MAALMLLQLGGIAAAQCDSDLLPFFESGSTDSGVHFVGVWDSDGVGPQAEVLLANGWFKYIGATPFPGIAVYDLTTHDWTNFPAALPDLYVRHIRDNGDILACRGTTPTASTTQVLRFANGTWTPMGSPLPSFSQELDICEAPNGDILASSRNDVFRWDGMNWNSIGTFLGQINCLGATATGEVVVGGWITGMAGGPSFQHIAKWNGSQWSSLGAAASACAPPHQRVAHGMGRGHCPTRTRASIDSRTDLSSR